MSTTEAEFLNPIRGSIQINAPSETVWKVISSPGNLEKCHPFCESNPVVEWPGKGSIDYVCYYNGLKYKRIFTNWISGVGYDLMIGQVNGQQSKVTWRIEGIGGNSCHLNITIYPHDIHLHPRIAKTAAFYLYIRPSLRRYLISVLQGFRWNITRQAPVRKNQFGTHRWFSD